MSMLSFTAEAALYKASRHYRTGRQALYLPRRTNSMRLALDEGEVIVIKDCPPGWLKLGEGVCIRDPSLPGGGGLPPGTPEEPSGEGPHGPGGGPPKPPKPPKPPRPPKQEFKCRPWDSYCRAEALLNAAKHQACVDEIDNCVSQHCQGKTHSERGKCEAACTDIVGAQQVCLSDPCFQGVPCIPTSEGWECYPIRGCPGWDWS
jgi:hypothetical protein